MKREGPTLSFPSLGFLDFGVDVVKFVQNPLAPNLWGSVPFLSDVPSALSPFLVLHGVMQGPKREDKTGQERRRPRKGGKKGQTRKCWGA